MVSGNPPASPPKFGNNSHQLIKLHALSQYLYDLHYEMQDVNDTNKLIVHTSAGIRVHIF
jgi:hypothetical protein